MAGQLTGLHAKFTGDSKSFVNAARLSAFELNKLNAKTAEQKTKAAAAASSTEGLAKSMHKLRMETDNAYAGMDRFQRASVLVKKVAADQNWSQEQLGAELQRLATHYGVAEAAGMSMGNQLKSARFHAANLTAQFNDIAVMLAAGQNPLMLAVQQGTQISQVMQAAGGSAKQMGALLMTSFRAMISPATLVTLALIAGGAALVQWASSAISAGKETIKFDDTIGKLGDSLSSLKDITETLKMSSEELADKFGSMGVEARNSAIRMLELEQALVKSALANTILESSAAFDALGVSITESVTGARAAFVALETLASKYGITHAEAKQLSEAFIELRDATTFEARSAGLENVTGTLKSLGIAIDKLPVNVQAALYEAERLNNKTIELQASLTDATDAAPKAGFLAGAIRDMDVLHERALLNTGGVVKLTADMDILNSALGNLTNTTDILKMSNEELKGIFGDMSLEARSVAIRILEFQQAAAETNWQASMVSATEAFSQLIPPIGIVSSSMQGLIEKFSLTTEQVSQLSGAFEGLRTASSLADRVAALENIRGVMDALGISVNELPLNLQAAFLEAEKLTLQAIELAAKMAEVTGAAPKEGFLAGAIRDMDVMYQRALDIIRVNKEIATENKIKAAQIEYGESRIAAPKLPVTTGNFLSMPLNEAGFLSVDSLMPPPPEKDRKKQGIDYESELEQLSRLLMNKEQLELDSYNRRQELLKTSLEKKLLTQEQYAGMMEQVESAHNFAMLKQQNDNVSATLGALGQLFQGSKQIGAAIALTNSYLAFTEVLKDPSFIGRPFARFAAAASALSSGLAAVRSIKSAQPGGSASGGISGGGGAASSGSAGGVQTSTAVSLQLVGGDMYSRDQVLQLINAINAATADGAQILLR